MIRCRLPCLVLAAALAFTSAAAQDAADLPPAQAAEIARLRAALDQAGLAEAETGALAAALDGAEKDEAATAERLAVAETMRQEAERAGREIAGLQDEIAADPGPALRDWRKVLAAETSAASLERRLQQARAEVERLRDRLDRTGDALTQVVADLRADDAADAAADAMAQKRSDADAAQVARAGAPGLAADVRSAAAVAAWRAEIAARLAQDTAIATLPTRQRLYEVRQRAQERALAVAGQKLEIAQARAAQQRSADVAALRERMLRAGAAGAPADAAQTVAANENLAYADQLVQRERELVEARRAAERAAQAAAQATEAQRTSEMRLAAGGGEAMGLSLLAESSKLADPGAIELDLAEVGRRLGAARLALIDLDQAQDVIADLPSAVADAARGAADDDDAAVTAKRAGLYRLLRARADLLPELGQTTRDLISALGEQQRALQAQLNATRSLLTLLERRLLWVRSHGAVDAAWLSRQGQGWADLSKPSRFATTAKLLFESLGQHWPYVLAALLAALLGLVARWRLPARLDAWAQPLKRVRSDRYRYTVYAFVYTALAALPAAALMWGLGQLLRNAGEPGKFSDSLGLACAALVPGLYVLALLGPLTRDRGLAHAHFRWTQARRAALARLRPWLAASLPMMFIIVLTFVRQQEPAHDTAGREMMVLWCLTAGLALWHLLAPDAVWSTRGGRVEPDPRRRALRAALTAGAAGLAVLALGGYVLTVAALSNAFWWSCLLVLAVALLHAMLARAALLGERRLALKRMEARREAEAETDVAAESGDAVPDAEPDEIALQNVNAQSRRFLRALSLVALALGLWAIWGDLLGALQRFDEVVLWTVEGAGGAPETISLQSVLVGVGVLALTFVAARNLPGLVELGLLSRISIDAPTRYAISSVSRYAIVIGGMLAGLSLLGLRWGQLQWMAAALTVGLGFGLQEIFGNFVSGLILLFERPFRVGDVITIGEVEGTVTRIRTRATTLLDWDNKEVVVPNKTFITERFVNWTLSDAVTRVVMKFGVAYGSDPERVRMLLLEIAKAEPLVLDDPPPTCFFLSVGASTYDFELRVFVREVVDRNRARTALHTRVVQCFEEEGIEIAFPQMDLRFRTPLGFRKSEGPL